jgi:hypothetical protein
LELDLDGFFNNASLTPPGGDDSQNIYKINDFLEIYALAGGKASLRQNVMDAVIYGRPRIARVFD